MTLIEQSKSIFDEAYDKYKPSHVFIMFSGGKDSVVAAHLFKDDPRINAAVHLDTGIKVPEVETHAQAVCDHFGLKLLIYRASDNQRPEGNPEPMDYDNMVIKHGFPGPSQHVIMYRYLKERSIRRLAKDHKVKFRDNIMLISGVRKAESKNRMAYAQEVQKVKSQVWVAPLLNWEDEDMKLYRVNYDLPISPVSKKLGMSGECLCGAYAHKGELERLRYHYPDVAKRLDDLKKKAGCPWHWDEHPPKGLSREERYKVDFMPLCTGCISRSNQIKAELMEWEMNMGGKNVQ